MKHDMNYHIDIVFKDGNREQLRGVYLDRLVPPHFEDVNSDLVEEVKKQLMKNGLRHNDIKTIRFRLNYSETEIKSDEKEFFKYMLGKTAEVFKHSATRKKYPDENWNFAICDTPIQKGKGLFFGLNWGGNDIDKQSVYPDKEKERNWNFVTHSRKYFLRYFGDRIEDLNYSNLCFFRSPDMNHFVKSDWDLAIPLFNEYVNFVEPGWALMMGKLPTTLKKYHLAELKRVEVKDEDNNKIVYGHTGILFSRYPFANVPHPQAHISNSAREQLWEISSNYLKSTM